MHLQNLIETHLDVARLSRDLDEIGHLARVWSIRQFGRADMGVLWEAAKGLRPLSLDDFVPPAVPPLVEVIHEGKNSLPLNTHFQKRLCRPKDARGARTLVGYNHQALSALTGPGYFVVRPSDEPGEVAIDYTMRPPEKPGAWPDIVSNRSKLGRFVYEGTSDVMRGLSSHVTVGRARKRSGKGLAWMDVWFLLVRDDSPPPS